MQTLKNTLIKLSGEIYDLQSNLKVLKFQSCYDVLADTELTEKRISRIEKRLKKLLAYEKEITGKYNELIEIVNEVNERLY